MIILLAFISVIVSAGNVSASDLIWNGLSEFDRGLIDIQTNAITAIGWSLFDSFFKTTQVLIFSVQCFCGHFILQFLLGLFWQYLKSNYTN